MRDNFNVSRGEALYSFQEETMLRWLFAVLCITYAAKVLQLCLLSLAPQWLFFTSSGKMKTPITRGFFYCRSKQNKQKSPQYVAYSCANSLRVVVFEYFKVGFLDVIDFHSMSHSSD